MASRISSEKAFHRFTFDVPTAEAIAFDESCIARGIKWSARLRELVKADTAPAKGGKSKKETK